MRRRGPRGNDGLTGVLLVDRNLNQAETVR